MGVWVGELWEALGVPVSQLEYVQRRHDSGSFAGFLIESVKSLVGICPFDTFHLEHRKLNFELLINPRSCNHDLLFWMGQKKSLSVSFLQGWRSWALTHSCALTLGSELHHPQRGMGAAGKVTLFNTFNLFFFCSTCVLEIFHSRTSTKAFSYQWVVVKIGVTWEEDSGKLRYHLKQGEILSDVFPRTLLPLAQLRVTANTSEESETELRLIYIK